MSTGPFPDGEIATPSVSSWVPVIIVVVVSAAALHAVLYGPAERKRAAQLQAEQIGLEDRALCKRLGMPHGTPQFAACADVLSEARKLESKRAANEVAGIL